MSFHDLPAELKFNIIGHLDPESSLHFALTSKDHSKLCQNLLQEHARLFAQYSILDTTNAGPILWEFLKEVLHDPRKGWYVRELNLSSNREWQVCMPEEVVDLYKAAAEELVPLYPYEPTFFAAEHEDSPPASDFEDSLINLIEMDEEDPIVILLIHNLPQLRTFRMTFNGRGTSCLYTFMRRIATGYQNPDLAPWMPLQHLRTAAVAHYDSEFSCSPDWAVYFLCIPSLRTFATLAMGSEGFPSEDDEEIGPEQEHLRIIATAPVSNVEELFFHGCQFAPKTLNQILPMIKTLKKFSYHAGGHTVAYQDLEPRKAIKALATHAGHSLEELVLEDDEIGAGEYEYDLPVVSLREFKNLRYLHCELQWLLRSLDTDIGDDEALPQGFHSVEDLGPVYSDPRDNLPEALEELFLDCVYEDEDWKELVKTFKAPNASTPKLTLEKLCVRRFSTGWGNRVKQAKFGGAAEPPNMIERPLTTRLFSGHGYA